MKSPAFQFYPKDFLASPDVQMMDAKEVGAYCLLLFTAWEATDRPGYLPNDERKLQRWARLSKEEWLEVRDVLLEKFPLSPCGLFRFNARLVSEAEKQEVRRERLAENGRKGGRPPKNQSQSNEEANNNLQVPEENLQVPEENQKKRLASASASANNISLSLTSAGENDRPADALPAEAPAASASHTEGGATNVATSNPLRFLAFTHSKHATIEGLAELAAVLKLQDVNLEYYQSLISQKAALEDNRTPEAWQSYATRFFTNDVKYGKLITNTLPIASTPQAHANARSSHSAASVGGQVGKRRNAVEDARALIQARRDSGFTG